MVSFSFKLTYLLTALTGLTTANAHYGDEQPIASRKPVDPVTIKLPSGFSATVVAEDLGAARHIVVSKTGDIYIKLAKLKDGKGIIRLRDTNNDGTPDQRTSFGDYPGTGIFLKNGYLYNLLKQQHLPV